MLLTNNKQISYVLVMCSINRFCTKPRKYFGVGLKKKQLFVQIFGNLEKTR